MLRQSNTIQEKIAVSISSTQTQLFTVSLPIGTGAARAGVSQQRADVNVPAARAAHFGPPPAKKAYL